MNLNIEIPDEVGTVMRTRAAAEGKDLATFVGQVIVANAHEMEIPETQESSNDAEFERRLDAWIALHPQLDHAIDDSRESLYMGRE